MKKIMKKLFAFAAAGVMMLSSLSITAQAADGADSYHAFIAIGADGETAGGWGLQYYGEGADSNAGACTAVEGELKDGETTSLSVTFEDTVTYTWFVAPCMIAENPDSLLKSTFDVKVLLDGVEIETDLSAGKACWAEDTGSYAGNCVRIGGGYNEWADKYIASAPQGFKTIEFQITPHFVVADPTEGVLSTEEYLSFIGIGAANDWSLGYAGPASTPSGVASAVDGTLKNGETTTISVTFDKVADYTWWVAPCMVIDDPSTVASNSSFEVKTYLDGELIETDLTVDKNFWAEGTDTYATNCIRIAGGYNEWGAKYIAESPKDYTTISFEITPHIYIAEAAAEEAYVSAAGPVDVNGTYNAYIGIQTPNWSFRNAFDDASYGRDNAEFFNRITGWDADNNAITIPGDIHDTVIAGNGKYSVSVENMVFPEGEFSTQDYLNLIFVSTDIPNTNEVVISDVVLKIDGKTVELAPAGAIVSPDSKDYINMLLQNIWNDDVKTIGFYGVPMSKISIDFTVSGFAYDKAEEVVAEAPAQTETAPAPTTPSTTEAPAESSSNVGLIVGIVVAAVVVCAGVVCVVLKKKKND